MESGRSWGHRPIWRWLALGVLILGAVFVAWRVYRSFGDTGEDCEKNLDCISRICLHEQGRNLTYCTVTCDEDAQCPETWKCLQSPDFVYRQVCIQP